MEETSIVNNEDDKQIATEINLLIEKESQINLPSEEDEDVLSHIKAIHELEDKNLQNTVEIGEHFYAIWKIKFSLNNKFTLKDLERFASNIFLFCKTYGEQQIRRFL